MPQVIDVFIASPGDVRPERRHAEAVVHEVSIRTQDLLGIVLMPVSWTNFLPLATKCGAERIQDRFTARARKCKIFIGILNQRYGTEIDEKRRISGTEEEFDAALENRRHVEILTYFRQKPATVKNTPELIEQADRLNVLQRRLQKEGVFSYSYRGPQEFRTKFALDLFELVVRISNEIELREQYRRFFQFGMEKRHQSPSVLIGYPAMHEHVVPARDAGAFKGSRRPRPKQFNWQERLLPSVVYEDFKCIQKVESAIRSTCVHDISSVTLDHARLQGRPGNRIWLCLPRNHLAQKNLARLGNRARFGLKTQQGENRPHIIWQDPNRGPIPIVSPLAKYLLAQKRPAKGRWNPDYGRIVARDYAVLARFQVPPETQLAGQEAYFHYYIAGIRGLGTWGVGWYIDRRPDELARLVEEARTEVADIQAILEVTFSQFRITAVRDVSRESAEYFRDQLKDETVAEIIEKFC
jgi:hypothetical protein